VSKIRSRVILAAVVLLISAGLSRADDAGPVAAFPWLHEGTVLTYSKHAAIVLGKPVTWKQDDYGDWIDPRTGRSYDKYINYGTSAPMLGQTRILAIDGNSVALENATFGLEQNLGFADPVLQQPMFQVADVTSNDYWKSPAVLAGEATDAGKGILVTHITWPFRNQRRDAVRIQITNDQLYQLEIYDLKTGICLHVASAWVLGPDADTHITRADLIRMRDLAIPWSNEAIPQSVLSLNSMRYVGQLKKGGAFARLAPQAVTIDFLLKNQGQRWIWFDTKATVSGLMVATPPFLYGPGEFCGLWIGPKAAASFQQGQILDEDPDTKMRTVVSKMNGQSVEITSSNMSSGRACVYDLATGIQTAWAEYDRPTQTVQTMQRQLSGQ
jgi:hypothetical protein